MAHRSIGYVTLAALLLLGATPGVSAQPDAPKTDFDTLVRQAGGGEVSTSVPEPATPPSSPVSTLVCGDKARAAFSRPLILGASVSSNFAASSPGLLAAKACKTHRTTNIEAQIGRSGMNTLPLVTEEQFADATIIVGVDLFFWDSWRKNCDVSLKSVDFLFDKVRRYRTPIVVGNIPIIDVFPPLLLVTDATSLKQYCRPKLNERITQACKEIPSCVLLDFDHKHIGMFEKSDLTSDGRRGLTKDGRHYEYKEITVDGLHPTELYTDMLSREILEAIDKGLTIIR